MSVHHQRTTPKSLLRAVSRRRPRVEATSEGGDARPRKGVRAQEADTGSRLQVVCAEVERLHLQVAAKDARIRFLEEQVVSLRHQLAVSQSSVEYGVSMQTVSRSAWDAAGDVGQHNDGLQVQERAIIDDDNVDDDEDDVVL